ncbi:MAG TPA: hypothetical protein VFG91_07725 [Woeseiaceae bacterium]|nr:hypothetical protein [Woeseiaceae bacterium]
MTGPGAYLIYLAAIMLSLYAVLRRDGSAGLGLVRALEQSITLLPRMICALVAAGFMVNLIPTEIIGRLLGNEAGLTGILIGSLAGLIVPSGPVISFAIASAFAGEGASAPALVSFITAWSLFAAHRIFIFEIPLLGIPFLRLRMLSVVILPFVAGILALGVTKAFD